MSAPLQTSSQRSAAARTTYNAEHSGKMAMAWRRGARFSAAKKVMAAINFERGRGHGRDRYAAPPPLAGATRFHNYPP